MIDFLKNAGEKAKDDKSVLYPIIASLTDGQRAGPEFVSLKELVSMAATDPENINMSYLDNMKTVSVYAGVDRGIFEKGGVGLTSDALRNRAAEQEVDDPDSKHNAMFYGMVVGCICSVAFFSLIGGAGVILNRYADSLLSSAAEISFTYIDSLYRASSICMYLSYSLTLISIIATIIFTVRWIDESKDMYNIKYDAIPNYMVDEKDIIGYNSKGEKVVLKNQSAYYKVVRCNRDSGNDMYSSIGDCGDLNGTTGKQWLAMYYVKNEVMEPYPCGQLNGSCKKLRGTCRLFYRVPYVRNGSGRESEQYALCMEHLCAKDR